MVDAEDSKTSEETRTGSSPVLGKLQITIIINKCSGLNNTTKI